jgi:hypothetical protein
MQTGKDVVGNSLALQSNLTAIAETTKVDGSDVKE